MLHTILTPLRARASTKCHDLLVCQLFLMQAQWQELQKVWEARANQRKKNVESLSQQLADWERTNTKRKLVVLSLPQDSRGNPNVTNAPASIKALIREMLVPKPQFPRVDSSALTDEKVRFAWNVCLYCRVCELQRGASCFMQHKMCPSVTNFYSRHRCFSCALTSSRPSTRC